METTEKQKLRLFVAAALPAELKNYLMNCSRNYALEHIKLVPAANLHLTLFFIGNTAAENISTIRGKLTEISQKPFSLSLQEITPGPNLRLPRLVWAAFAPNKNFENLAHELQQNLAPENNLPKQLIPHITLARFAKNYRTGVGLPVISPAENFEFKITEMSLWRSELASPHPKYSVLETFPFNSAQ